MPPEVPGADRHPEVQRIVRAQFGLYSAGEAARRAGSKGHSPTAAVKRWVGAGRIFAVPSAGLDAYPGFCFDATGRPHPGIAPVVKAFGDRLRGWDLAQWWVTEHAGLGGRRPVDLLDGDAGAVAAVAREDAGGTGW